MQKCKNFDFLICQELMNLINMKYLSPSMESPIETMTKTETNTVPISMTKSSESQSTVWCITKCCKS